MNPTVEPIPAQNPNPTPAQPSASSPTPISSKKASNYGRSILAVGWFMLVISAISALALFKKSSTTSHSYYIAIPLVMVASIGLIMQGSRIKKTVSNPSEVRKKIAISLYISLFMLAISVATASIAHAKNIGLVGFFSFVLFVYLFFAWFQSKKTLV
jgi:hypothetical protein